MRKYADDSFGAAASCFELLTNLLLVFVVFLQIDVSMIISASWPQGALTSLIQFARVFAFNERLSKLIFGMGESACKPFFAVSTHRAHFRPVMFMLVVDAFILYDLFLFVNSHKQQSLFFFVHVSLGLLRFTNIGNYLHRIDYKLTYFFFIAVDISCFLDHLRIIERLIGHSFVFD